ncbi:MAG: iron-containing redox enzyme family protein [Bdellovibrionales bacterium]
MTPSQILQGIKSDHMNPTKSASIAHELIGLAKKALVECDSDSNEEYQKIMYYVHYLHSNENYGFCNYLAALVEPLEAQKVELEKLKKPLSNSDFRKQLDGLGGSRVRVDHPMTIHLLSDKANMDEVKFYLLHNWYRARYFYKIIADLAQRVDLDMAGMFYDNLKEETGGEHGEADAHTKFIEKLVKHMGIPCRYDDTPGMVEALEYLNHRKRCSRSPNIAWGVGVFYAIESTAGGFATVQKMLDGKGISKEFTQFHSLHSTVDCDHERLVMDAAAARFTDTHTQEIIFSCVRHHQKLSTKYFDAIWRDMRQASEKLRQAA